MSATGAGTRLAAGCASTRSRSSASLVVLYMLIPIAVIFVFSFNDPAGRYNFTWVGFTLEPLEQRLRDPGAERSPADQPQTGGAGDGDLDRDRDDDGAGAGPPPVLRPPRRQLPDRDPDGDARGRDGLGAALLLPHHRHLLARLRDAADRPRDVLHQLRRRRRALAADRLRPPPRGGGEGPRREPLRKPSAWSPCR